MFWDAKTSAIGKVLFIMVMHCQKLDLWHDDASRFLDGAARSILRKSGLIRRWYR
jgi:hypothetical protein